MNLHLGKSHFARIIVLCMKKILLLILLIAPAQLSAQYWLAKEEDYFFVSTSLDIRNAIFGGTVNEQAYDGIFSAAYRSGTFQILAYYETFKEIEYESFGMNPGYVFRPGKIWVPVVDLSLSLIRRPFGNFPSLASNTRMEIHFDRFFAFLRGEFRWRTDFNFFQVSLYGGIAYKFGFK